ncbi:efflux RND transporter periplasmic adaptor subunit, partial [Acinetobacter baumannii]
MTTLLELPGEIRFNADRMAHVVPRVAGVVEEVSADLGASMAQGQVMAVIASTQLAEQRSELLSAKKRLDLARTTYER